MARFGGSGYLQPAARARLPPKRGATPYAYLSTQFLLGGVRAQGGGGEGHAQPFAAIGAAPGRHSAKGALVKQGRRSRVGGWLRGRDVSTEIAGYEPGGATE